MRRNTTRHRFFARVRWLIAGVLMTQLPVGAGATELTEAEFLAHFDDQHPSVVASTERLARAEAERRRAGVWSNPSLEFEHEAPADEADQSTLKLGWKPPLDGRRSAAVDASEAKLEAAREDFAWARLQLRQQLRAVFSDWAVAERRRELMDRHHENLRALEERLNTRAARGEESLLAANRFALAMSELRGELARAEAELARIRGRAVAVREGLPADATPILSRPPAVPASVDGTSRPDLLARQSELEAAIHRRRLAGRVLEFPTLVFGWTSISTSEEDVDGPYFGVAWNPPLFDRNQGDRDEAAREVAIAEARLRLAERDASERKTAALAAYATLYASLLEVTSVVESAPDIAAAASASFLAGESSMTDLLETLRSVLQGQLAALELHADVLAAHRELELSTGHVLTGGNE